MIKLDAPWIPKSLNKLLQKKQWIYDGMYNDDLKSEWTNAYFSCDLGLWLISYTAFIVSNQNSNTNQIKQVIGLISGDIDVSRTDIDQCDVNSLLSNSLSNWQQQQNVVLSLAGTHKCHKETTQV